MAATASAYFDVDGTLVGTNLLHPTLVTLANQANPLDSVKRIGKLALSTPALIRAELEDRRLFNEKLFAQFAGMTEDRLVCLAEEIFEDVIEPRIFPGTRELVRKCKEAGLRVVLITGSLDVNMGPLARHLGADHVIANRLEMKDGFATGKLVRPVVAGPGKARIIADDARQAGHDLALCHAYSDSESDVPMLSVVGHPFCVNPDKGLRKIAAAYSWPVLDLEGKAGRKAVRLPFGFYA